MNGRARVLLLALCTACSSGEPPSGTSVALREMLGGAGEGFLQADPARELSFPRDHAAHPGFRTEWWYVTGNLRSVDPRSPRRLGFQLTFFRSGLAPDLPDRPSPLATGDAWMAHLAVTDAEGDEGRTLHFERFARDGPGSAGVARDPLVVSVGDWRLRGLSGLGPERTPSFRAEALEDGTGVELLLRSRKELVLQGQEGYSRKGPGPTQASHYVSATRLETEGRVWIENVAFEVTGSAWLDREWTSSLLGPEQLGWDWFQVQLDDGTELMAYRMRRRSGVDDPTSHGSFVDAQGTKTDLARDDYEIDVLATWTSSSSGATYPSGWRLTVPSLELELELVPPVRDCEIGARYRYWEGPCDVRGTRRGEPVTGVGYAELVGYDDGPTPR